MVGIEIAQKSIQSHFGYLKASLIRAITSRGQELSIHCRSYRTARRVYVFKYNKQHAG